MDNLMKPQVAIIDYEMGNLFSIEQACKHVGLNTVITSDASAIMSSDAIILPGVGAFGDAMANMRRLGLISPIKDAITNGTHFLGICLGMQLLFSRSAEFGNHEGLNIIDGEIVKFPAKNSVGEKIRIPQVGWNQIFYPSLMNDNCWFMTPLKEIKNGEFMYFVHSYYPIPSDKKIILSISNYEGTEYCSGISYKNIFAFQFHPEKSAGEGIKIYKNWASMVNN